MSTETMSRETVERVVGRMLELAVESGLDDTEPIAVALIFPGPEYAIAGIGNRDRTQTSKALMTMAVEELKAAEARGDATE